jgi:hypothetical protein
VKVLPFVTSFTGTAWYVFEEAAAFHGETPFHRYRSHQPRFSKSDYAVNQSSLRPLTELAKMQLKTPEKQWTE